MSCAIGKKFCSGKECTCFSPDDVFNFVVQYNKFIQNKTISCKKCIKIKDDNEKYMFYYLAQLKDKLCEGCDDLQLLRTISKRFVKRIYAQKIFQSNFRPIGPTGYEWLSNFDINAVMEQYSNYYKNFLYIDTVPIDFSQRKFYNLYKKNVSGKYGIRHIGTIYNTDPSYKPGQHWIASFVDFQKEEIFFYDSVGNRPPYNIVTLFEKTNKKLFNGNKKIYYNDIRHQFKNSECGVYCLHFITKMLEGVPFKDFCNMRNLDDASINKQREVFFNESGM